MAVKNDVSEPAQKRRRAEAEKVGRLRYIIRLLHRLDRRIGEIDARTRTLMVGLRDLTAFDRDYLKKVVVTDAVDEAIIQRLIEVPEELPSRIAVQLRARGFQDVRRWGITRRIQRMNRRLKRELGQAAFEKRGHCWALTTFMRDSWGVPREEIQDVPGPGFEPGPTWEEQESSSVLKDFEEGSGSQQRRPRQMSQTNRVGGTWIWLNGI